MTEVQTLVVAARQAATVLVALSGAARKALLVDLAAALRAPQHREAVMVANAKDMVAAAEACARGQLDVARRNRLGLDPSKLDSLADGLEQLAAMSEWVGRVELRRELDAALVLERVTCPLGLLGVVFEARPDAVPQIVGLALKTGNAVVLKGGSEALHSNRALVAVVHSVLAAHGVDPACVALLADRAALATLLELDRWVDLVVARGSKAFVEHVRTSTKIPVMGHAEGLCHLYLHHSATPAMAAAIAVDAKCSYPAACNAIETLLWDADAGAAVDACIAALQAAGVELRGCPATLARHPGLVPAVAADWDCEYGALILAVRQVSGLSQALDHIAAHGSRHTEAIVGEDQAAAAEFLAKVDAACFTTRARALPMAIVLAWVPRLGSPRTSCTRAAPLAPKAC